MNFDDLLAIQNEIARLQQRNRELEAENAKLHALVKSIRSTCLLAKTGVMPPSRLSVWILTATDKVLSDERD